MVVVLVHERQACSGAVTMPMVACHFSAQMTSKLRHGEIFQKIFHGHGCHADASLSFWHGNDFFVSLRYIHIGSSFFNREIL
jgi:hypothetical protein